MSDPTLQRTPAFNLEGPPPSQNVRIPFIQHESTNVDPCSMCIQVHDLLPLCTLAEGEGQNWTLPIDATSLTTGSLLCVYVDLTLSSPGEVR